MFKGKMVTRVPAVIPVVSSLPTVETASVAPLRFSAVDAFKFEPVPAVKLTGPLEAPPKSITLTAARAAEAAPSVTITATPSAATDFFMTIPRVRSTARFN
jgi:hypothetical protein